MDDTTARTIAKGEFAKLAGSLAALYTPEITYLALFDLLQEHRDYAREQQPATWRIEFVDSYTGEGGDLGMRLADDKEARLAAQANWNDVTSQSGGFDQTLPYGRFLTWQGNVGRGWYTIKHGPAGPSHRENVTYTVSQVAS